MRCALKKKMRRKWSINLFFVPPQCLWMPASVLWPKRLPTSLKNISNGSVSNIFDDHIALSLLTIEPSLEMDPNTAKMEFFSKENSGKWVVLEKWHEYQLKARGWRNVEKYIHSHNFFSQSAYP